ncbi:SDR family oxidoreductase [Coralliovum pocilloporae]|uniref:SDR family oxidoreductase n=1 Tax=Coralliovum pocilloporae TaxID=3066369 RepID=UPI003306BB5D
MSKTVLITGAARRIGKRIALYLASEGYSIVVHYNRSQADAEAVVADIVADGGRAVSVQADLRDQAAVSSLIGQAESALGTPLDVLINNASVFEDDKLGGLDPDLWDTHMALHVKAPVFLAEAFAASVGSRDAEGVIINIIDQRVWKLTPQFFSYTLSKSALMTATKTMAQSLAPAIRVNAIGPGPTLSNQRQSMADFQKQASSVLLERPSKPMDIARTAQYLIEMPSVTGQMIAVDSGQHLNWYTADVVGISE